MTQPITTTTPNDDVPDATSTPAASEEIPSLETPPVAADASPSDVERVRTFILATQSDLVPELITGETVADLLASVETARTAYQRLRERDDSRRSSPVPSGVMTALAAVADQTGSAALPVVPPVPAGGARPFALDPDRLPPSEKIRRGLQRRDTT